MKISTLVFFILLSVVLFAQKSDSAFTKETHIHVKPGATINGINKTLYEKLNDGNNIYQPDGTSYFINPYVAVGVERHFKKHFSLHFNVGFYQTLEKYTTTNNFKPQFNGTLSSNYIVYEQGKTQYLNNNVFLELLPAFIYNNTRILGGLNITNTYPTISSKLTATDTRTGKSETTYIKDRPEGSYHLYSIIGILQGVPIKTRELTLSISYFGLLKKYDSGLIMTLGFMF